MTRTLLCTGGYSGIGRQIVKKWLELSPDHKAVVLDRVASREASRMLETLDKNRAIYEECDVRDSTALGAAFAAHASSLHVAVNNAGVGYHGFHRWEESVDINLKATIQGTMCAIDAFRARQATGVVINVASLAGLVPLAVSPVYTAAKAGVVSFVRSLHRSLQKDNIHIHAICPSFVDTPLVTDALEPDSQDEDLTNEDRATRLAAAAFVTKAIAVQGGLMTPEFIAEHTIRLVQDAEAGSAQGPILYITPQTGASYEEFPPHATELAFRATRVS